jgi:hypothetical protein
MCILTDSAYNVLHFSETFASEFQLADATLSRDFNISQIISTFEDNLDSN